MANNEMKITIDDIAQMLRKNRYTIYRWIKWYYSDLPKPEKDNYGNPVKWYLPDYELIGKNKMYNASDVDYFKQFEINLVNCRGVAMRDFNNYYFNHKKDEVVGKKIRTSVLNQLKRRQ